MNKQARNFQLDFLRFIGISCIILAHQHIPSFLFQLRNFDVPLMVIISGIAYINYSEKHYKSYTTYLKNRFIRLVIPTWLFLIFYNLTIYIYSHESPTFINILKQITLTGGIDIGIWIIRIFVSMAFIAPFINFINKKIENDIQYYLLSISLLIFYEFLYYLSMHYLPISLFKILKIILFFTVGYALLLWYGMRIHTFCENKLRKHIVFFSIIFICYMVYLYFVNHSFISTQKYKYPPQLYYLSYALMVSVTIYFLTKKYSVNTIRLIEFIGSSTLWIYLWHWFVMKVYSHFTFPSHYLVKYIIVYSVTVSIVYIQSQLVFLIVESSSLTMERKKILNKILTG